MSRPGAALVLLIPICGAAIIDRIAVSVGNEVITQDQVQDEMRVTAFLNHEKLDLGPAKRRETAERMVQQILIKREMEFSHYPEPRPESAQQLEANVVKEYGGTAGFERGLAEYGVTLQQMKEHLLAIVRTQDFIEYRFRPAITLTDEQLRREYERRSKEWKEKGQPAPPYPEAREAIEKLVTDERVDRALNRWLNDTLLTIPVVYHDGAFQ